MCYFRIVNALLMGGESFLIYLVGLIIWIVGMWNMFKKAGRSGWASIIPFYGRYVLFDIAWGKGWLFLLSLVPIVDIPVFIMCYIRLAKAFGKGICFGVATLFLTPICMCILGFGSAEYIGPPYSRV